MLEHGVSVGAVATLYYVLYEQFIREKNNLSASENVIATLIAGYVPADDVERAAKAIAEAIERDVAGGNGEIDIRLLSKLIIETLAHLNR